MLKFVKTSVRKQLNHYIELICRKEFESQAFVRFNERPVEFSFVFKKIGKIYPRTILDVGSGTTALPHLMRNCGCLVTATDNVRDYWPAGMLNRHYHIIDDDIIDTRLTEKFDAITCISVLEHIEKPDDAVRNMLSLLKPNGHLILSFPYSEKSYIRNVYELSGSSYGQGAPYITQSYSRSELDRWLKESPGAIIVDQEYWRFWEGDYWTVGNQVIPPEKVGADNFHQLTCILIRKS